MATMRLIKLFVLIFAFYGCSKKHKCDIEEAINVIPKGSLPTLLIKYINGQINLKAKGTFDSCRYLLIQERTNFRTTKVYSILHRIDSLNIKYITIINHSFIDSLACCNEYKSSIFSIEIFQIKDNSVINITQDVLPKDKPEDCKYDLSKSPKWCNIMEPFVYIDSIILRNRTKQENIIKFTWLKDGYYFDKKITQNCYKYSKCDYHFNDSQFIQFYNEFAITMQSKDSSALAKFVQFPIEVNSNYYTDNTYQSTKDTVWHISNFKDLFNELYSQETRFANYKHETFNVLYGNKLGKNSINCDKTLQYESSVFPIGPAMASITFSKTCDGYKLTDLSYMPVGMDQ